MRSVLSSVAFVLLFPFLAIYAVIMGTIDYVKHRFKRPKWLAILIVCLVLFAALTIPAFAKRPPNPCRRYQWHCQPTPTTSPVPTKFRALPTIVFRTTRIACFRAPCP